MARKKAVAPKQASWGGKSKTPKAPTHRWQGWGGGKAGDLPRLSAHRWKWRVNLAIGLLLLAILVILLIPRKTKTPVITLAVTNYEQPVPPNAWALEDQAGLETLVETLAVKDISPKWQEASTGKTAWDDALDDARKGRSRDPLIFYISMHGLVDDVGRPCLLPPRTSPLRTGSFLRIEDLLDQIAEQIPAAHNKLLILDSNRILVNWNMGIVYNSFAERLEKLIEAKSKEVPNLAVIASASPGQRSWASPDLNGSAFGQFLQLGLAGFADSANGNEDGEVSLHELAGYLQAETRKWSTANRAEPQVSKLLPDGVADFRVAWSVESKMQQRMAAFRGQVRAKPAQETTALWRQLDELRTYHPVRYDPLAWRDWEHRLLRLEQLSEAGAGYKDAATREFKTLTDELAQTTQRASQRKDHRALASHWSIFSNRIGIDRAFGLSFTETVPGENGKQPDDRDSTAQLALHTLPLGEYLGVAKDAAVQQSRSFLAQVAESDGPPKNINQQSLTASLEATQLVYNALDHGVKSLWNRPNLLRDVLGLRTAAEELAVPRDALQRPGDERSHYYVRNALEFASRRQHELEDTLFVGELNAPGDLGSVMSAIRSLHTWAEEVRSHADQAYVVRDRVWAETPYLAAWLCRPLAAEIAPAELETEEDARDELISADLLELIKSNRRLSQQLDQHTSLREREAVPFRSISASVDRTFTRLKRRFDAKSQELVDYWSPNASSYRAIHSALTVPLMAWDKRKKLVDLQADIAKTLHADYLKKDKEAKVGRPPNLLETLSRWDHPLVEILRPTGEAEVGQKPMGGDLTLQELQGVLVRQQLEALTKLDSLAASAAGPNVEDVHAYRRQISNAAQRLRAAAAVWFSPPDRTNPIRDLRHFDVQQLLLWHRQQLIEGAWQYQPSTTNGEKPFFASAADRCLRAAKRIATPPEAMEHQIALQNASLSVRQTARIQISARSRPLVDVPSGIRFTVSVGPQSDASAFSPGLAAVFIRDQQGRRLTDLSLSGGVELPFPNPQPQQCEAVANNAAQLGTTLYAVSFFRGQELSATFVPNILDGVVVDFEPYVYGPPSITLLGDRQQRSSFIFILDCSNSMKNPVDVRKENPGPPAPRLGIAKDHLANMLFQLARTDTRVGVKFVGHRIGYKDDPANNNPTLTQQNWPHDRFSKGLVPPHDVETIFRLREFDNVDANTVRDLLNLLTPWGQSPLYLALVESFGEFVPGVDARKEIIAITDGQNYQQLLKRDAAFRENNRTNVTKEFVLSRPGKVPVHFFDFAKGAGEKNREFGDIADETGGTYFSATTGEDLLTQLRKRLDLDGYSVVDESDNPVNPMKDGSIVLQKLNATLRLKDKPSRPHDYAVQFRSVSKTVTLEGGEGVRLQLTHATQNNQDVYDIGPIQFGPAEAEAPLLRGPIGRSANHKLRADRPRRTGNVVRFRVSIQSTRDHFTRRPQETWLEVAPLSTDSAGDPYVFYDTNYEPDQPVPVLSWDADNWPSDARLARLSFWCKYQTTPAAVRIPVTEFAAEPERVIDGVTVKVNLDTAPDGKQKLRVVQRHPVDGGPKSRDVYAIRVLFETESGVRPSRVVRRFDRADGIATHEFFFTNENWQLINNAKSAITAVTRKQVQDGAFQLEQGRAFDVRIFDAGGVLPIEASAGVGN